MLIPEYEQRNILDIYWMFLRELEGKTDPETQPLNRILVEDAYKVLHRIKFTEHKPRWTK